MLIAVAPPNAVVAQARRAPATSVPATSPELPQITRYARTEFLAWQRGTIDRTHYTVYAATRFTDEYIQRYATHLRAWGELRRVSYVGKTAANGTTTYDYLLSCANALVEMRLGVDGARKIDAISFRGMKR